MDTVHIEKRDLLMPLFINLIGDFNDVKKLFNDGKPIEAYDLFKQKYDEIEKSTRKPSTIKSTKIKGI